MQHLRRPTFLASLLAALSSVLRQLHARCTEHLLARFGRSDHRAHFSLAPLLLVIDDSSHGKCTAHVVATSTKMHAWWCGMDALHPCFPSLPRACFCSIDTTSSSTVACMGTTCLDSCNLAWFPHNAPRGLGQRVQHCDVVAKAPWRCDGACCTCSRHC